MAALMAFIILPFTGNPFYAHTTHPGGTAIHHGVRRGRGPVAQGPAFQGGQPSAALRQHLQGGKEELSLSIARRGWHPSAQTWMLSCVRCFASGVMTVPKSLLLVPCATLP
mgnify:CR=1 FL=1